MESTRKPQVKEIHILAIQIFFLAGITFGLYGIEIDQKQWLISVARFLFYLLSIQATREVIKLAYAFSRGIRPASLDFISRSLLGVYGGAAAILVTSGQRLFDEHFPQLFAAYLVLACVNGGQVKGSRPLGYGQGMACNFFEGYLKHIMTSDGHKYDGLVENLRKFEDQQGQVFPVKKLFLVVPKTLFCPPDLKYFNKDDEKLAFLEPLKSLEDVTKDVAAVKNRVYRNSVYKVYRAKEAEAEGEGEGGGRSRPRPRAVCVALECPTPLHTLHGVCNNRGLYQELADMNIPAIVEEFESTLMRILDASPECRGKVVIVHFDDTNPTENLSDVILDKIRELRPDFEDVLNAGELR